MKGFFNFNLNFKLITSLIKSKPNFNDKQTYFYRLTFIQCHEFKTIRISKIDCKLCMMAPSILFDDNKNFKLTSAVYASFFWLQFDLTFEFNMACEFFQYLSTMHIKSMCISLWCRLLLIKFIKLKNFKANVSFIYFFI